MSDATLYAGFRAWPGGEIWINPEIDQGFGLSDTFGVAGYLNRLPNTQATSGRGMKSHSRCED